MLTLLLLFFYSDKGRRYSLPFLKVTSCPSLHRINYLVAPFSCLPSYIKKRGVGETSGIKVTARRFESKSEETERHAMKEHTAARVAHARWSFFCGSFSSRLRSPLVFSSPDFGPTSCRCKVR